MVNLTAGVVISSLNGAELGPGSVLCHVLELRCVGWSRDTGRGIGPLCTGTCCNFLETLKWMSFQMVYQCLSPYFLGAIAIYKLFRIYSDVHQSTWLLNLEVAAEKGLSA